MKTTITVNGMHCKSCELLIKDSLQELSGMNAITVMPESKKIIIDHEDIPIKK
jgi:copper chaperone CopZ